MATFFASDIHGEYSLFCRLLDEIRFCSSDTLFILGDLIDKGKHSVKLANFIFSQPNIKTVCGNHEQAFLSFYEGLMRQLDEGGDADGVLIKLGEYFSEKQEPVTWELLDYLEALPPYIETDEFICVHAGVEMNSNGQIIPLENNSSNTLIFDRRFADKTNISPNNKTVLFGHTPCHYKNKTGRIIKTPKTGCDINSRLIRDFAKIQMDNGVFYTKMLGALRLEDMREFYVKKI